MAFLSRWLPRRLRVSPFRVVPDWRVTGPGRHRQRACCHHGRRSRRRSRRGYGRRSAVPIPGRDASSSPKGWARNASSISAARPSRRALNQYYCYCVDEDFGTFFLKFCSYFPFNAKLCVNGNGWAKRQAARARIGFESLDNGFAAVDDVPALQAICPALGREQIDALLR